jgi:hypothetical protein
MSFTGTPSGRASTPNVSRTLIVQSTTGSANLATSPLATSLTTAPISINIDGQPLPTGVFAPFPNQKGGGGATTTPPGFIDYPTANPPAYNSYDVGAFPGQQSQASTAYIGGAGADWTGRFTASFAGPITRINVETQGIGFFTNQVRIGLTHVNGIPQLNGSDAPLITTPISTTNGSLFGTNGAVVSIPVDSQVTPGTGVLFYVQVIAFNGVKSTFTNVSGGSQGTYEGPGTGGGGVFNSSRHLKIGIQFGNPPMSGTLLQTITSANATNQGQLVTASTLSDAGWIKPPSFRFQALRTGPITRITLRKSGAPSSATFLLALTPYNYITNTPPAGTPVTATLGTGDTLVTIPSGSQITPGFGTTFYVIILSGALGIQYDYGGINPAGNLGATYWNGSSAVTDTNFALACIVGFDSPVVGRNATGATQVIPAGTANDALRTLFGGANFPGGIDAPPMGCRWIVKQ